MANSGAGPPASPGAFLQLCTAESQNAFLKAVSEGAQAITRRLLENQQATAAEYGSAAATLHRFRRAADEAVAEAMRREIGTLLDKKKAAFMTMERDHALEEVERIKEEFARYRAAHEITTGAGMADTPPPRRDSWSSNSSDDEALIRATDAAIASAGAAAAAAAAATRDDAAAATADDAAAAAAAAATIEPASPTTRFEVDHEEDFAQMHDD